MVTRLGEFWHILVLFACGTEINYSIGMNGERCLYVSGRGSLSLGKMICSVLKCFHQP